jgi:hypothetical protein
MASKFDVFVGVPASDTFTNRIEMCRARAGIPQSKVDEAYRKVGLTDAQMKLIAQARTARDLTSDINGKLAKVLARLAERAQATVMWINFGAMAGESRVPDWAKEISN